MKSGETWRVSFAIWPLFFLFFSFLFFFNFPPQISISGLMVEYVQHLRVMLGYYIFNYIILTSAYVIFLYTIVKIIKNFI